MKLRVSAIAAMLIGAAPVVAGYLSVVSADPATSCVYATNKAAHQVPRACTEQAAALRTATPPAHAAN
ncbi:MAG TPA: hypothetical protein VHU15_12045 [Stellaceae bacterium]|nr:hypothetical protein [Stellaceae bacterium]